MAYDDPHAAAKRVLLERMNRDRARLGVPALRYDNRAALAGDAFCVEAAFAVSFPLEEGPGYYFVVCQVRKTSPPDSRLTPGTAAMITAVP